MTIDVVLPNLGFGMEEGRLIAWLKKAGERVRKGEPIAEVESDKTTVELEAVVDGVIEAILEPADKMLPVGAILARIRSDAEPPAEASKLAVTASADAPPTGSDGQRATPVAQRIAAEHQVNLSTINGSGPGGRITREDVEAVLRRPVPAALPSAPAEGRPLRALAAPAVRKLARDTGIDLSSIQGTGEQGHVTRADLEAVLAKATFPSPAPASTIPSSAVASAPLPETASSFDTERTEQPFSPMRQAIARRLVQSAQEAPHFYATAELDLTDALAKLPSGIGINVLVLYLTVQTLHDLPDFNATYENGHLYRYAHVHLAMAVAQPNGLLTPVLRRADDYSLTGLADQTRSLVARARENKLRPEELSGGSFTVSNLGMIQQVDHFTAILNPPQVGILAVGAAKERAVVRHGGLHIRTTAHFTLSADHRVIDGLLAGRFLEAFDQRLQDFGGVRSKP